MPDRGARRGLFPNAGLIARREYLDRIRSRAFLVSTLIVAVAATLLALLPIGLKYIDQHSTTRIAIVADETSIAGDLQVALDAVFNRLPPGQDPAHWEKPVRIERRSDEATALGDLRAGRVSAVIVARRAPDGGLDVAYHSTDIGETSRSQLTNFGVFGVAILDWNRHLLSVGRPSPSASPSGPGPSPGSSADTAFHPPTFTTISDAPGGGGPVQPVDQQELAGRTILAMLFVVMMFISLVTYGMWVATSVATEKSSRVMELLVSAATPLQLLTGKVLGVGAAGLTQYLAIVLPGAAVLFLQDRIAAFVLGPGSSEGAPIVGLTPGLLVAYGAFFLLGLGLYTLLYAGAGSLVSRQEDVQQLAMPLSLLTMGGYIVTIVGLGSVSAGWFVGLSYVPFFSPFVMLARVMVGRASPLEIAISIALLLAAIGVAAVVAARVYSAGVLLYGQRPGIRAYLAAARVRR